MQKEELSSVETRSGIECRCFGVGFGKEFEESSLVCVLLQQEWKE